MEYNKIVNPQTGRKCLVSSQTGKKVLKNYIARQSGGNTNCQFNEKTSRCSVRKDGQPNDPKCHYSSDSKRCRKVSAPKAAPVKAASPEASSPKASSPKASSPKAASKVNQHRYTLVISNIKPKNVKKLAKMIENPEVSPFAETGYFGQEMGYKLEGQVHCDLKSLSFTVDGSEGASRGKKDVGIDYIVEYIGDEDNLPQAGKSQAHWKSYMSGTTTTVN